MSKYQALWEYVAEYGKLPLTLSFDAAADVLGFPIDHSFLTYKKEAAQYNFTVGKISLKDKTITFCALK